MSPKQTQFLPRVKVKGERKKTQMGIGSGVHMPKLLPRQVFSTISRGCVVTPSFPSHYNLLMCTWQDYQHVGTPRCKRISASLKIRSLWNTTPQHSTAQPRAELPLFACTHDLGLHKRLINSLGKEQLHICLLFVFQELFSLAARWHFNEVSLHRKHGTI